MSTWYLGPLGDLRPLVCPDTDVKINDVRYGGIHQGLSGARTMDVTGLRSEIEMEFSFLDQDEYQWLDLLHSRTVPGPHWLINPLRKNRLSQQATRLVVTPFGKAGVRPPVGARVGVPLSAPSALGFRPRTVFVWDWTDQSPRVVFDYGKLIPVLPNETLSGSVWLRADTGSITGSTLQFEWFDIAGEPVSGTPSTSSSSFSLSNGTWARQALEAVAPPAGAVSCRFSVVIGTLSDPDDTTLAFTAPQVEAGESATDFEVGGGAPMVLIDQLETESPRYPYRNVTLKMLEA